MEHGKKQKILEVSRKLFYEEGYGNTTVRQIAEAAGVSTSVLFHYFKNKRDVLVHIVREFRDNRRKVVELVGDDLSQFEKRILRLKLILYPMLNDHKLLRLHVDEINEKIIENTGNAPGFMKDLYIDKTDYLDETYNYDELLKYRYYYYLGSVNEITLKFYNGSTPFNKINIDHHIISCFNMFFNIPISEIVSSIKRVERVMNLISFDGFGYRVLNDEISEYIGAGKKLASYDFSKVVFINDIVFSDVDDAAAKNKEWLKENYDKAIILVKYYGLINPVDIKGIQHSIDDFDKQVINSYLLLKDNFAADYFVTGFIDNSKAKVEEGIINQFEKYGVDALKTLYNITICHADNHNVIAQCAFIFYK
ncbi:HTH-type transcriptional repressor KstR2 [Oxobacter pfennigii]|uniref:HTH-type transcriptional repressor KstR2 n=1 Tax=Oxobacter pfennigii TaxID=36849 RepID=A0A0P8WKG7_9CLOT|nr:TetR/AcrR family transcriptional regulator [Oxobacter pfennigii]KPU42814.1 HTH-type transcriptional repressor KstR2 [Oxobacter pfennigii]